MGRKKSGFILLWQFMAEGFRKQDKRWKTIMKIHFIIGGIAFICTFMPNVIKFPAIGIFIVWSLIYVVLLSKRMSQQEKIEKEKIKQAEQDKKAQEEIEDALSEVIIEDKNKT